MAAAPVAMGQSWVAEVGGPGADWAAAIAATGDGGHVVVGTTTSAGSGGLDGLAVRLDPCGSTVWQFAYGGPGDDLFAAVAATADGDFVIAGESDSFGGSTDWWVLRLSGDGAIEWQRRFGGDGPDGALGVATGSDRIVAVGSVDGPGGDDGGILALDPAGAMVWSRLAGGAGPDTLSAVGIGNDGTVTAVGATSSGPGGALDGWIVRLDDEAAPIWQVGIGGTGDEALEAVVVTETGVAVTGSTDSPAARRTDQFAATLNALGDVTWQLRFGGADNDDATAVLPTTEGFVIAGDSVDAGAGTRDALVSRIGSSGVTLGRRSFGGAGERSVRGLAPTRDGVLLFGDGIANGEDALWLVATGADGYAGANCPVDSDPAEIAQGGTMFATAPTGTPAAHPFATASTSGVRLPADLTRTTLCALVPAEVASPANPTLRFLDPTRLTWAGDTGNCAAGFHLYAGDLATLTAGGDAACLEAGLAVAEATVRETPASEAARYYLVTGVADGGEGPAGRSSAGTARAVATPCPP